MYELRSPLTSTAPRYKLAQFEVHDHQIELARSFEFDREGISRLENQILTFSSDGRSVEFRSLESFEVVESVKIAEEFLSSHNIVDLQLNFVVGINNHTSQSEYYDILSNTQLQLPISEAQVYWRSFSGRFCAFRGKKGSFDTLVVYDLQEHRACLSIPYRAREIAFLEDDRVAVSHSGFGVSTTVYDLHTGDSMHQAPYRWFAIVLAMTLLLWFGWLVAWIVVAYREGSQVWNDLAVCALVLFGTLACLGLIRWWATIVLLQFALFVKFVFPTPIGAIILGCFVGLQALCIFQLLLRRDRRPLSALPTVLSLTAPIALIAFQPSATSTTPFSSVAALGVCAMIFVACCAMAAVWFLFRKSGWRIDSPQAPASDTGTSTASSTYSAQPQSGDARSKMSLNSLFAVVGYCALLVAAVKPLISAAAYLSFTALADRYWLSTAMGAFAISSCVIFLIMHQRSSLRRVGWLLAVVAWLFFVSQEVLLFAGFKAPVAGRDPQAIKLIIIASTTAFAGILPFSLRGYRLAKV